MSVTTSLLYEAERFIRTSYAELGIAPAEAETRIRAIELEIRQSGTYTHTEEELTHGAKLAWRNSNRCIGRLFWDSLRVRDARAASTPAQAAEHLVDHIYTATNGGKIIPTITIFAPETDGDESLRIWNHQLIRYAGYEQDGRMAGDPASLDFTSQCRALGWRGQGSDYDVLPLVIQKGNAVPEWFPLPPDAVLEVELDHPEVPDFQRLGLKWYAVPIISDMSLEIGGIRYPSAPFNGWYMGTEIGSRNLADTFRYNKLPAVAAHLGLDTSRDSSLWIDRALLELNTAVLYSFKRSGVSIVDHHTAASQFRRFEEREQDAGRSVTGDWTWLIPPMSPASTHIFHAAYKNELKSPMFRYQERPY
ncbi:nitric oxide synthase, oxygenase domain-containing protein [Paenibacillus algicola]|uniref:Nitric oxide synthase oxygenase n=1 Tax=Paenibacillus algicola TaxID=2565926 RepID=A0A4P8XL75_9BACL|nr:nitric oxide synthase oxygenase [Paenibacillus algicola]QCT03517.1 nitric oxide synthase, oxygenase domain-containing protein [Paenibacillus algicola]